MTNGLGRAALLAFLVVGCAGSPAIGSDARTSTTDRPTAGPRPVAFVHTAEVSWIEPPRNLGLVDGWTVELAEPSDELRTLSEELVGGVAPRVRVIGLRTPGRGDRVVHDATLEVSSGAGVRRFAPADLPSAVTDGLSTNVRPWSRPTPTKDDTTLEGRLAALTTDGLTLDVDSTMYAVVVTPETEFRDFDELSELEVGDLLEVRGELDGTTIVASRIRLRDDDVTTLEGSITSLDTSGFELDVESTIYEVVVTAATRYTNIDSLADLEVGDEVKVKGALDAIVVVAEEVELRSRDGDGSGGVEFEFEGLLLRLLPPDRFRMSDGRTYRVDPATVYDPIIGSYPGLSEGQYLNVEGLRVAGGDNLAVNITYEGDTQGGQGYYEIEGHVSTISAESMQFDDGTVVAIRPTTLFTGDADSWTGIAPGWEAEAYVLLDLIGNFRALEIRTEDPEPATVGGQDFEPQQALVVPVEGAVGAEIADRFGAEIAGRVGDLAVLLWWPEPIDDRLLADLTADQDVAAVEPNYFFRDPETVRRRYPTVDRSATNAELLGQMAVNQVRMPEAHQLADGRGMVVAVIDTGVDPLHPVLRHRLLSGGLDLVDGDSNPWEERGGIDDDGDGDVDEATGHGTFVASLIAVAAPGALILPYRVLDDDGGGTAYDLALALADALQRRVDVINLSLVYQERSTAVDLLLERAAEQGIVVVTSAGNDGLGWLPFPASDSHTVAVGALSRDGQTLAGFSNRSDLVDLAAPGEEIYGGLDDQSFGTSSGTSMAAPFVSATVAILLSLDPTMDPVLLRNALLQAGVPIQDGGWTGTVLDMAATTGLISGP